MKAYVNICLGRYIHLHLARCMTPADHARTTKLHQYPIFITHAGRKDESVAVTCEGGSIILQQNQRDAAQSAPPSS